MECPSIMLTLRKQLRKDVWIIPTHSPIFLNFPNNYFFHEKLETSHFYQKLDHHHLTKNSLKWTFTAHLHISQGWQWSLKPLSKTVTVILLCVFTVFISGSSTSKPQNIIFTTDSFYKSGTGQSKVPLYSIYYIFCILRFFVWWQFCLHYVLCLQWIIFFHSYVGMQGAF